MTTDELRLTQIHKPRCKADAFLGIQGITTNACV